MKEKLKMHKGRFTTLQVKRKNGITCYNAKIQKITDKTITFWDVNGKQFVKTNLENLV